MYPSSIQKLTNLFSKFPGVGPKVAARFVFYLLKKPKKEIEELNLSILDLKEKVKICSLCFNPFEPLPSDKVDLCWICQDPSRDKALLCIIANETDLNAIEKTKKYKGLYFILGGQLPALKKTDAKKLEIQVRIENLEKRIKKSPGIQEIILALNPTTEGETTALYLERILTPSNKKITRLGRGLQVGGELEYADEETLSSALESRR